jgi:asparagine synthase (glutamine-hydrolysing)
VFNKARADGLKVLLGGQGGDEAFMGYRKYLLFYFFDLLKQRRFGAVTYLMQLLPTFLAEIPDFWEYWHSKNRFLTKNQKNPGLFNVDPEVLKLGYGRDTILRTRQIQDVTRFSLPTLLRYEDRNSMGNSIESRLPFMDYRLIELGLALPEILKLRYGYGKWILRRISRQYLPKTIYKARYKKGFNVQINHWVNLGVGRAVRHLLNNKRTAIQSILGQKISINSRYSDESLIKNPHLLHEAISLSWVGCKIDSTQSN